MEWIQSPSSLPHLKSELGRSTDRKGLQPVKRIVQWLKERGGKDIALPPVATPASNAAAAVEKQALGTQESAFEIPTVSAEDYIRTREAVEAAIEGVFITSIRSVSIEDLLEEDGNRKQRRFNHDLVNSSKTMRDTFPPAIEVFINPKAVRIEGSNNLSTDQQKVKIAEAEARFKDQLPERVRSFVSFHMVDPSTYAQIEDAWMDEGKGVLFPDFFARTDVKTVSSCVADVGRLVPTAQRGVREWIRDYHNDVIFAVPVGVLPRE